MIRMLLISLATNGLVACGVTRKLQSDDIVSAAVIGTGNTIKKENEYRFYPSGEKLMLY